MIESSGHSETGPVRENNEDCFLVSADLSLFVVADGMGGHAAGEVAARLAVDAIAAFIRDTRDGDGSVSWPGGIDPALSFAGNRLWAAIHRAHEQVRAAARERDDYAGMGTTVVCALIEGRRLLIGHVGDSRLYRLIGGQLRAETRDDTWGATVLAGDDIDRLRAATHPMRNVLTNVIGARDVIEIHVAERELTDGEIILLCSDGVHNALGDAELTALLSGGERFEALARVVVERAIASGGRDNATAVVLRYSDQSSPQGFGP
jgi:protein phosphatase